MDDLTAPAAPEPVPAPPERKLKLRRLIQVLLGAIAAVWIVVIFQNWNDASGGIRPIAQRKPAAEVAVPQLDGAAWRLSEHRGQVVLINYWASWCGPCREETPGLIKLSRDYRYKGLSIVGVALDDGGRPAVQSFVNEFHVTYPVLLPDAQSQLASNIDALPTSILIDRQGRAAKTYVGAVSESEFQADVEKLLAENSGPAASAVKN